MVVVLKHKGCSSATWYQTVAVFIKRATGLRRLVHPDGKSIQRVKRCHRVIVGLLSTTAEHHVLQSLADEHITQSNGVTATGTGRADGEVDASEVEDGAEVHVHRRVHRLENETIAQHGGIVLLVHDLRRLDDGFGGGVVAKDTAYLVLAEKVIRDVGLFEGLTTGHIGILSLFRHAGTGMTVHHLLRNDGCLDDARKS